MEIKKTYPQNSPSSAPQRNGAFARGNPAPLADEFIRADLCPFMV
jgi:hypothetical protein